MVQIEETSDVREENTKSQKSKKRGRPKGSNSYYVMKNGKFKKEDLFLYTPENTLPKTDIARFLQQCDNMLMLLDARTVNQAELEEIAKVYREGIIVDAMLRTITDNEDGTVAADPTTINSLDKILKTVEKRKENLSIRAKDKENARDLSSQITMMDVIASVGADVDGSTPEALELNKRLEEEGKKLTSTEKFMEEKTGNIFEEEESISDSD